jgi:hypothetical protein
LSFAFPSTIRKFVNKISRTTSVGLTIAAATVGLVGSAFALVSHHRTEPKRPLSRATADVASVLQEGTVVLSRGAAVPNVWTAEYMIDIAPRVRSSAVLVREAEYMIDIEPCGETATSDELAHAAA